MKEPKRIDIKEFREQGFLQELNRQFLHPLGLALEIVREDDGTERLGGIWDYRDDPEGIYYDLKNSDEERLERFEKNELNVNKEREKHRKVREKLLGNIIEQIPF